MDAAIQRGRNGVGAQLQFVYFPPVRKFCLACMQPRARASLRRPPARARAAENTDQSVDRRELVYDARGLCQGPPERGGKCRARRLSWAARVHQKPATARPASVRLVSTRRERRCRAQHVCGSDTPASASSAGAPLAHAWLTHSVRQHHRDARHAELDMQICWNPHAQLVRAGKRALVQPARRIHGHLRASGRSE